MSYAKAKRRNINALPVLFRVTEHGQFRGTVDAVFPTLPANPGHMLTYAHHGQHSEGAEEWFYGATRPAKPEEYAGLLAEVRAIYERDPDPFELVVCRVVTPAMREERTENEKDI